MEENRASETASGPKHMSEKQGEKLLASLRNKGALLPCQRCAQNDFTLQPGFSYLDLQRLTTNVVIGSGDRIPVVFVVCNACGAINTHALGALTSLEDRDFWNG